MAPGSDHLMEMDASDRVSRMSREYFAPDALGMVHQDAAHRLQYKGAAQVMGE